MRAQYFYFYFDLRAKAHLKMQWALKSHAVLPEEKKRSSKRYRLDTSCLNYKRWWGERLFDVLQVLSLKRGGAVVFLLMKSSSFLKSDGE